MAIIEGFDENTDLQQSHHISVDKTNNLAHLQMAPL